MTKTEINQLRKSLIEQQSEMMGSVGRHGVAATSGSESLADENERADRVADEMIESQLGYAESQQLKGIAIALEKIDAGEYGVCEDCKKEIYIERLKALPHVALCIDCQSKKEKVAAGMF